MTQQARRAAMERHRLYTADLCASLQLPFQAPDRARACTCTIVSAAILQELFLDAARAKWPTVRGVVMSGTCARRISIAPAREACAMALAFDQTRVAVQGARCVSHDGRALLAAGFDARDGAAVTYQPEDRARVEHSREAIMAEATHFERCVTVPFDGCGHRLLKVTGGAMTKAPGNLGVQLSEDEFERLCGNADDLPRAENSLHAGMALLAYDPSRSTLSDALALIHAAPSTSPPRSRVLVEIGACVQLKLLE